MVNRDSLPLQTEPADATSLLFFQAATSRGAVGLTLPREENAEGSATGIEQVLRLAQAEPLLCAVEQWLRSDWDPVPCDATDGAARHGCQAVVRDPALAPPGAILHLPLAVLRIPPPEPLRAPALAWRAHAAELTLDSVPASILERLESGALVLLPQSFGPEWMVRLRDPAGRLPDRLARLDLTAQRLEIGVGAVADPASETSPRLEEDAQPSVRLVQRVQMPLDLWLGFGRANTPFRWPIPQPWLAELRHANITRGCGALLPLGQGYGMLLDSVDASAVD